MSFSPVRVDGGGLLQYIDISGGVIFGFSDTQGAYRDASATLGNGWQVRNKGIGASVKYRQMATGLWSRRETSPQIVYAGTGDNGAGGGLLAWSETTQKWSLRSNVPQWAGNHSAPGDPVPQFPYARPAGRLLVQDAGSDYLFAGTYKQGVLQSASNGNDGFPVTCQMAGATPTVGQYFCTGLCQFPGTPTTIYGCFYDSAGASGVWKCTNAHAATPNFTKLANSPSDPRDIIVLANGSIYVAAGNNGLYRSTTAADTVWTAINGGTPTQAGGGLDVTAGNSWWSSVDAYTDGSGNDQVLAACGNPIKPSGAASYACVVQVSVTNPGGAATFANLTTTGNVANATIPPTARPFWNATAGLLLGNSGFVNPTVRWDPADGTHQKIYCSGDQGMWRSANGGTNWTIANNGLPQFLAHPVAVAPNKTLGLGDSDWCVFEVTDGDGSHGAGDPGIIHNQPFHGEGFSIAYGPDSTAWLGTGAKYTNSSGEVWTHPPAQPNGTWVKTGFGSTLTGAGGKVAIGLAAFNDAGGHQIVLAATWGSGMWRYAPNSSGVYGWTQRSGVIGASGSAGNQLPITYAGNGLVFAYDRKNGVYRSSDYGLTWVLVWNKTSNDYQAGTVAYDPTRAGKLWVSTASGLYLLPGGNTGTVTGGNITPVLNTALPGKNGPIAFDTAGNLYCALQDTGGGSGLVRSPDGGVTWADIAGDNSFAECNCNPEFMVIGPDGRIYVSGSNIVATGFAGGGGGPAPGVSSPFTPVQVGQNIGANQGVLNLFLPSPSTVGTMLLARLVTTDQTATITAPTGWALVEDQSSGTGAGVTRAMIWAYYNNPGGLAVAGSTASALRGLPHGAAATAARPSTTGGPRTTAQETTRGTGGGGLIIGGAQVASGGAITFTSSSSTASFKGKLTEFSTPAGTVQAADQVGGASGTTSATALPVTASTANAYTGGMAAVMFGASWSPAPTGQTWTTPAGWTQDGTAVNSTLIWSQYSEEGITAGPTTVTGTINLGSGGTMTSWAAALATFYAIVTSAVSITTTSCPNGTVNAAYSKTLLATGGALPYSWALASGTLPTGLTLSAGGVLSGTPTVAGTYSFTVQVTDSAAQTATASYTVVISGALSVTTASLPNGATGTAYSQALAAAGGKAPYSWAVTAGALPSGLGLSAAGAITGTPLLAGTSSFTVQVTDSLGATATAALSITVTAGPLAITTTVLAAASLGVPYTATLTATGGTPPYTWAITSGALPSGITLASTGALSGTPTAQGTFTFTATVTDSALATASVSFTLTISLRLIVPPAAGPWRILYGPTQPTGGVTGEVLQAQNKTITLRTEPDQNHEVSFDADGLSPAINGIVELETDLIVMYGSRIIFDGRVVPTQDILTASAHRTVVTALDYREVLRRRAVLPGDQITWTNVDQATIAWNMIQAAQARPGGNLGIVQGVGTTTGVKRTQTSVLGDYIGDDITNLAKLNNGFEWQITPYGFADLRLDVFYPQQGTNRGVVLAWGSERISSITRNVDPSTFADCVYVTSSASSAGTKTLTPVHLEAADIGTRAEQRWDTVIGVDDQTQSTLNDDATALLNQAQVVTPSYVIVFKRGQWGGPSDIFLGDTVTVQIDSGRLEVNDQLRVVEMMFALDADNVETLTLTVGAIPFRLHRAIPKILKSIRYLKTR